MNRATKQTERTLVVLSERYLQSGFGEAEWAEAFGRDPTGEEGLVVPVRIEACSVGGLLRNIVYIDLVGMTPMGQLYPGGPKVAAFSANVQPLANDAWTLAVTNTMGAFQALFQRFFDMRSLGLRLPTAGAGTAINDNLVA